jgi:hypothetical protein
LSCRKKQQINADKPVHSPKIPVSEGFSDNVHYLSIKCEAKNFNRFKNMPTGFKREFLEMRYNTIPFLGK